uniref:Uncharacterized protein n=1 Tax=Pararge aegeria TaxID=116150 RepID=S4PPN6_9NEOP
MDAVVGQVTGNPDIPKCCTRYKNYVQTFNAYTMLTPCICAIVIKPLPYHYKARVSYQNEKVGRSPPRCSRADW